MTSYSTRARCEDCYFRSEGLCALKLEAACPTFRPNGEGALARVQPVPLQPRPLAEVVRAQMKVVAAA